MRMDTRELVLVCVILMLALSTASKDDDDEDYDPFTTTDPAKREPSPCESEYTDRHGPT